MEKILAKQELKNFAKNKGPVVYTKDDSLTHSRDSCTPILPNQRMLSNQHTEYPNPNSAPYCTRRKEALKDFIDLPEKPSFIDRRYVTVTWAVAQPGVLPITVFINLPDLMENNLNINLIIWSEHENYGQLMIRD